MDTETLKGKSAIVMGGSSGMGLASAQRLAESGAAVMITGRRQAALTEARETLLSQVPGAHIATFAGDASEEELVKAAMQAAHDMIGRLDILVSSVGGGDFRPMLLLDTEMLMNDYKWNLVSVFLMVKHGVPLMKSGGSIVCLSTANVIQPLPGILSYASAKAALERFVRGAALELGGTGIRINAVRPGLTRTGATAGMYDMPGLEERYAAETPLGRTGEPEDVASVIRFLAGPESAWVTGQTFSADGGQDQGKLPDLLDDVFGKDIMEQVRAGKAPKNWK